MEHWKRKTALFLGSQVISLFGSSLVQYAIMWYITLSTQSGVMMTISIICGFIPTFLLSPFAGVWADRYNRKMLIVLADALIAISTLALAILFMLGYEALWLLFLASAVRAVGAGIQGPAVGALLPQIVPEDKLMKVNGINGSLQSLNMLAAPMVSGALLTAAPLETIFFIDVVTAAIAIFILLAFLQIPAHRKAAEAQKTGYIEDLKKGYVYIREHSFLKQYFLFFGVVMIFAAPPAFLTPLQVARSFGDDVWRLTAIEVAFSIGMMLGGAAIAAWGGFKNKTHTIALGCIAFGVCTLALGIVPDFWVYLGFMALTGLGMPFFNTPAFALIQEKVEGDYLGRVFGVFTMISTSMMPLGMLIFGPIADVVQIEWLLIGSGIIFFLLTLILLANKTLIEAGRPEPQPQTIE